MQDLEVQNELLRKKLRECKIQIETGTEQRPENIDNRTTYATVAARKANVQQPNSQGDTLANHSQSSPLNLRGFDLDLLEAFGTHFENTGIKNIRERLLQALKTHAPTQDIQWVGLARRGSSLSKARVCLRTQEDERKARIHTEWINSHFRGARIQGEWWHVVKFDCVNKNAVRDSTRVRIHGPACAKMSAENSVTISKMHCHRHQGHVSNGNRQLSPCGMTANFRRTSLS